MRLFIFGIISLGQIPRSQMNGSKGTCCSNEQLSLEAGRVTCCLLEGQMVLIKGSKFPRRFQPRGGGGGGWGLCNQSKLAKLNGQCRESP